MGEGDEVRQEIVLPVEGGEAWSLVTEAEHLSRWLEPEVSLEAVEGADVEVQSADGRRRRGVVEQVDEGARLVFRWWPEGAAGPDGGADESRVEIVLAAVPTGTRVTVVERRGGPTALALGGLLAARAWRRRLVALRGATVLVAA